MPILTSSNNFVTKHFVSLLSIKPETMRLTFIPTAAETETGSLQWLKDDRQALMAAGFKVTDFTLTGKNKTEVKAMLDASDFVFVSGGNTLFLLQEMNKSGFTDLIGEFVQEGGLYGGSSAGSVVAGPDISLVKGLDDASLAPELGQYTGLSLSGIVVLPHWGSQHFKSDYDQVMKDAYKKGLKIVLLTDDQYLVIDNGKYVIESL